MAEITRTRRSSYDAIADRSFASASAAAKSLRRWPPKPCTAYSISKEARRLSELANSKILPVSANTIRNNLKCRELLDEDCRVVLSNDPAAFPRELRLMSKDELMQLVMNERKWAAASSSKLIAAELALAEFRRVTGGN